MNTIIQQQLELHFGDTYPNVVSQTVRFCKTVVDKPWWGQNRNVLLNNEGGMSGMRTHALTYIIELEDITLGLKAYGKYLRSEYGLEKPTPLEDIGEFRIEMRDEPEPFGGSDSRGSETPSVSIRFTLENFTFEEPFSSPLLRKINLTTRETEFFQVYASVSDVKETCALMAISEAEGWRIWMRVKNRATYHNRPEN